MSDDYAEFHGVIPVLTAVIKAADPDKRAALADSIDSLVNHFEDDPKPDLAQMFVDLMGAMEAACLPDDDDEADF